MCVVVYYDRMWQVLAQVAWQLTDRPLLRVACYALRVAARAIRVLSWPSSFLSKEAKNTLWGVCSLRLCSTSVQHYALAEYPMLILLLPACCINLFTTTALLVSRDPLALLLLALLTNSSDFAIANVHSSVFFKRALLR
jgi:hypothetical protein